MPKVRNPKKTWLLAALTGGIYTYFWAWEVAEEINEAEGRNVLKNHLWRAIALVLFLMILATFVYSSSTFDPWPVFGAFFAWAFFCIYVQIKIGNYIKQKKAQLNLSTEYSVTTSIALMYLVGLSGIAYMQSALNKVILSENWAS